MRARDAGLALALCLAACVTPTSVLDRRWIEVSSDDFSVYTTLSEADGRKLLGDLETFRATVFVVSNVKQRDPRVPTEIYAFASRGDFGPFKPGHNVEGFFHPGLRSNRVAFSANGPIAPNAVMFHEYTHFLVRNENRLLYPRWFDEGFAELLGSVQIKDASVAVGTIPEHRMDSFRYLPPLPFSRIVAASDLSHWPPKSVEMFYAQSWLLVHYLMYGRGKDAEEFSPAMTRYLSLLEQGTPVEQAFPAAFAMELDDLQPRIGIYARRLQYLELPRDLFHADYAVRVRPVGAEEIGVRLGWLALANHNLEFAGGLFERAGGAAASNSRALAGIGDVNKFNGRYPEAEAAYRASLELEPDNWENHLEYGEYFLQRAQREEPERAPRVEQAREHFRRAIALAPGNPEGYTMLGMTYVLVDEPPGPGIEALEHAESLLPSHPSIQLPLAQLQVRAGNRERAIPLLRRVIQWSQSPAETQEASRLLAELEGRPATDED